MLASERREGAGRQGWQREEEVEVEEECGLLRRGRRSREEEEEGLREVEQLTDNMRLTARDFQEVEVSLLAPLPSLCPGLQSTSDHGQRQAGGLCGCSQVCQTASNCTAISLTCHLREVLGPLVPEEEILQVTPPVNPTHSSLTAWLY